MDLTKLEKITQGQIRSNTPEFREGDKIKVHVRIREGVKERIQMYEGLVMKRIGHGVNETFTVRKFSGNVGVERTFLVNSPLIAKIDIVEYGKVRRARIFYMRDRIGKAATKVKRRFVNNK